MSWGETNGFEGSVFGVPTAITLNYIKNLKEKDSNKQNCYFEKKVSNF